MRTTLLLAALLLAGCDDTEFSNGHGGGGLPGDGGADGGTTDGGGTTADSGWCGVQQVLATECVFCHGASAPAASLDLVTDPYGTLVDQPSGLYSGQVLVVSGDADSSFLVAKISATQASDQGDPMPPGGGLDPDQVEVVRAWIDAGATDVCDETGTTTADYHPEGFDDPAVHGLEAKLHEQTCTDCHGADLGGDAGPSCDTCHDEGWRTNCTFCHGGVENETGAPPEDIDDSTTEGAFGAHGRHVEENTHAAFDCTQCHSKPTDVLTAGHLFDSTPAIAEVVLSAGLSPSGSWDSGAMACSNLYCHGNGQGNNGTVEVADAPLSCSSCHPDGTSGRDAWGTMSGEHEEHLREGMGCESCHEATTRDGRTILAPALHVDGDVDIALEHDTITWSGSSCNGSCHGEDHEYEPWRD